MYVTVRDVGDNQSNYVGDYYLMAVEEEEGKMEDGRKTRTMRADRIILFLLS